MSHASQNSAKTLVFGCGYLGRRVAAELVRQDTQVWGTTRSSARAERLQRAGIRPLIADWLDSRTLCRLPQVDRVLVAVSYDPASRHDRYSAQVDGLRNLLSQLPPQIPICYISTTGVFHQQHGEWVDEASPCRPLREAGRVALAAEGLLRAQRPNSAWTILRLSGIYGPQRLPRVQDVLAGRPIATPQHGYLNLIHVEDAVAAVIRSWAEPRQRLYLVSDDRPVVRSEFYRAVAERFQAPPPVFVEPSAEASVSGRAAGNKRVWNRRVRRELLPRLKYPTFLDGIQADGLINVR